MHRIAPVVVFALLLAACGGSDGETEAGLTTTTAETTTQAPPVDDTDDSVDDTTTTTTTEVEASSTETPPSTEAAGDGEAAGDEIATLCDAYLRSINPSTLEAGLDEMAAVLGPDAPPGVQAAIEVLTGSEPAGIEEFFAARDSIDGYVLPVCRDRFAVGLEAAADSGLASQLFYEAVKSGDLAAAERLAPDNVVVQFDWDGYPTASTSPYSDVDGSFGMVLEPTVTVFCRAASGLIESCAFGE